VSRTLVGTSPCTNEVNGLTRSTPCPTGWTGNYTEQEIITQMLPEPWNMGNILRQSSRWVMVDSTQCTKPGTRDYTVACEAGTTGEITRRINTISYLAADMQSVKGTVDTGTAWEVGRACTWPCPAGWASKPAFGSNANHCWWSQYENPRCVGVDMQMIGVGYVFDRTTGTPTRTEDPGNMWTSEPNSPTCGYVRPCPAWATHSDATACWAYVGEDRACDLLSTNLYRGPLQQVFDRTNGAVNSYVNLSGEGVSLEEANSPTCGGNTNVCYNCDSGNSASDSSAGTAE
jgi:hypothetical protein